MTTGDAQEYCGRKVQKLQDTINDLNEVSEGNASGLEVHQLLACHIAMVQLYDAVMPKYHKCT